METPEKNVVRRFYELVDQGRPEALDEVCAADLVGHGGAGSDLADLKTSIASFLAPFPDLTANVRHLIQEGDQVSVWLTYPRDAPGGVRRRTGQRTPREVRGLGPDARAGRQDRRDHAVLRPVHDHVPDRRAAHRGAGVGRWPG